MRLLLPIIEQAIINGVISKGAPLMHKNKAGLGLLALSGLITLVALGFLIFAGYGWLLINYDQPTAAFIVSAVLFALALVSVVSAYFAFKKKPAVVADNSDVMQLISEITDVIGEELAEPIEEHPKTALLLASLAGFAVGDRLH